MKSSVKRTILVASALALYVQTALAQKTSSQFLSSLQSTATTTSKTIFTIVQVVIGAIAAISAIIVYIESNKSGSQSKDRLIGIFGVTLLIVIFLEICKAFFVN